MLDKYFFACLMFVFSKSTVSSISLDYYFGIEDSLRSAKYIEDCNTDGKRESCQLRCGPNHACLLGKCFCVDVKPQYKSIPDRVANVARDNKKCEKFASKLQVLDDVLRIAHKNLQNQRHESREELRPEKRIPLYGILLQPKTNHQLENEVSSGSHSEDFQSEESYLLDQILRKSAVNKEEKKIPLIESESDSRSSEELQNIESNFLDEYLRKANTNQESRRQLLRNRDNSDDSVEDGPEFKRLVELALRPTLRHQIAHFCPNLKIARKCVKKCLERGKPAFCGKDHICYCGHKYGTPGDDIDRSEEHYSQFQDLYKHYLGPRTEEKIIVPSPIYAYTTTTRRPKTPRVLIPEPLKDIKVTTTTTKKYSNSARTTTTSTTTEPSSDTTVSTTPTIDDTTTQQSFDTTLYDENTGASITSTGYTDYQGTSTETPTTSYETTTSDGTTFSSTGDTESSVNTPSSPSISTSTITSEAPSSPSTPTSTITSEAPSYPSISTSTITSEAPSYPSISTSTITSEAPSSPSTPTSTITPEASSSPSISTSTITSEAPSSPSTPTSTITSEAPSSPSTPTSTITSEAPSSPSTPTSTITSEAPSSPSTPTSTITSEAPSSPSTPTSTITSEAPSSPSTPTSSITSEDTTVTSTPSTTLPLISSQSNIDKK